MAVVLVGAVVLGVVSFLSNITSIEQLSGQADVLLATRLSFSRIVNAGAVWGALSVVAGYAARGAWSAACWGTAAPVVALLVHYGAGEVTGWTGAATGGGQNLIWFAAAALLGAPLGIVGFLAKRPTALGMASALVAPTGAVLQPLLLGTIGWDHVVPWPSALADLLSGAVLIAGGVAGICILARVRLGRL